MPTVYQPVCRSFVRRARPFSSQQQQEYRELLATYGLPLAAGGVQPRPGGWVLDVGFGNGDATRLMAERNPATSYLAVEVYRTGLLRLMRACKQQGLANVSVFEGDAVPVINGLPPKCLQGVHLFFPDPWPKKRHHQRRFLRRETLEVLSERLLPTGYLYFVTDWRDYAESVAAAVAGLSNWRLLPLSRRPWRPQTAFEKKALQKGHRIFELLLALC